MKLVRYLAVALIPALTPSCFIYSDDLLGGEGGDSGGSGGSGNDSNGGSGNSDGGGTGGGTGNSGNTGGTGSDGGGGTGSGGGDGGTGSGGSGDGTLVSDFAGGDYQFNNAPFYGKWWRTGFVDCDWAAADEASMVVELLPDEEGNYGLQVDATCTSAGADWGVDTWVTILDSGTPMSTDVSAYTGVRFRARTNLASSRTLNVKLEDALSNSNSAACTAVPATADCNNHAGAIPSATLNMDLSWKELSIPFTNFQQGTRSAALDLATVYAIHFAMDADDVDFIIDDVYFYE